MRSRLKIYSFLFIIVIVYCSFIFVETIEKSNDSRQLELIAKLRPIFFTQTEIENQRDWIASSFQVVDQFLTSDAEDDPIDRNKKILDFL